MTDIAKAPLGYLSDQETRVDLLNNEAIARTVVRLIREKSGRSVTIGIHGDWGAGKSSVLEMVDASFPDDGGVLCLKFNGWQFQGFEDAKIALIEGVVNGLIEKRSLLTRAKEETKRILASIDMLKVARRGGGLLFNVATGLPSPDQVGELLSGMLERFHGKGPTKEELDAVVGEVKGVLKDGGVPARSIPKEIREFRKAFAELIDKAGVERLVVLIDDLDRCLPETAIGTLEAVRLFVALDKTAFVVGADEAMIQYAVRKHFPDLQEAGEAAQPFARSYLEKLLQVPFRIPALGETETQIYVSLLLLGAVLGEDAAEFESLLALGRAALARPWEGRGLEQEAIRAAVGDRFDEVRDVVVMAEQISPVLSAGTKGNPRQIKRFLNALALRLAVATERGFGEAVGQAQLAKLMLAELFLPASVFAHIASSAAGTRDGLCPELVLLESLAASGGPGTARLPGRDSGGEGHAGSDGGAEADPVLADWSSRPEVVRWAAVKPDLGTVSLKPYLFVIKDRHNYLGAATSLSSKLMALLDRLAGGEASARGATQDVRTLAPQELDPLFAALRRSVLASSSFDSKPEVMGGVAVLVGAHPALQERYVELLEALPIDKLGPWAAAGHAMVDAPGARQRLDALLVKWRRDAKNPALRTALGQAVRLPAKLAARGR